jgi:hypothetical protein
MNTSDAFVLAGKISWCYTQKYKESYRINFEIAQALGPDLYKLFCLYVCNPKDDRRDSSMKKNFVEEFLNRQDPYDTNVMISDIEVYINYNIYWIMECLAKVTSDPIVT